MTQLSLWLPRLGSLYAEAFRRLRAVNQDEKEETGTTTPLAFGRFCVTFGQDTFRRTLQDIKRKNANMLFHVVKRTYLVLPRTALLAKLLFFAARGARAVRTNKSFTDEQVNLPGVMMVMLLPAETSEAPNDLVQVNRFLDEFLTARIGTDILSSQYLSITRHFGPGVSMVGLLKGR